MDPQALKKSIFSFEFDYRRDFIRIILLVVGITLAQPLLKDGFAYAQDITEQEAFFEAKVRPILVEHCVSCHGADEQSGGLRLDAHIAVTIGEARDK